MDARLDREAMLKAMMLTLPSAPQEKCHQYWPAERSARYQYFVVDPMAEYNMPQYILREFKVTDARVSCGHRRCCGYWEGKVLDDLDFNLGHPGWKWGVAAAPVPWPGTQEVGGWVTGFAGC